MHSRNIIKQGLEDQDLSKLQVVITGFGGASIGRSSDNDAGSALEFLSGTYISPILRWYSEDFGAFTDAFDQWIDWNWNDWIREYSEDIQNTTPYMESIWWDFLHLDSE